jgi:flavin reductase (DIM6/NTAB) family NADH-FMN oxidoreductase RutF
LVARLNFLREDRFNQLCGGNSLQSNTAKVEAMRPEITADSAATLSESFRMSLRGLAKSVVLISTVEGSGKRHAMAATAVTPVSMTPPSMLFCINRDASSYSTLLGGADFCINILTYDQLELAQLCSGAAKGEARFASGAWMHDNSGVPYLDDALATIICTQDQRVPYGTHDIFIGLVRKVAFRVGVDPLVYANGNYKRIAE